LIQAQLVAGSEIFMDNLFTSFPLLDRLTEMGIAGTGTVRQNRLHRVPIISKKEVEKKTVDRGFTQTVYRNDQVCSNSVVQYLNIISTYQPAVYTTCL
jgi:hypothetical protein